MTQLATIDQVAGPLVQVAAHVKEDMAASIAENTKRGYRYPRD